MARSRRDAPPRRSPMAKCSRNAFPNVRQWQDVAAACFRAVGHGNISPWCIPERSPMTEMCPPASDSGKISPRCVFGRRSVAAFSLHAFPKGPRTGKAPVRGNIPPPCIQNGLASARYARHASEKPCKRAFGDAPREDLARKGPLSLHGPLKSCTARRSCHSWVLRLSALTFLRQGRCLRFAHCPPACVPLPRIARSCAVSGWVAAPPLHAPLRPNRVVGSACRAVHAQLLLACISVVASATRPKRRNHVIYRRKHGAVMVFR